MAIQNDQQIDIIRQTLTSMPENTYGNNFRDHLLAQYFKYLDMADKISDRRSTANTFFLSINTGLISAIGIAKLVSEKTAPFTFTMIGLTAILLCFVWRRLIRSYDDLNTAKFKVIHEFEKHLPTRPFDAEWESVGRGENKKLYLPFTHVERNVPIVFMLFYGALVLYLVVDAT